MRLVATRSLQVGERLAKAIHNDNGQTLLHKGVHLSKRLIERLIDKGIYYVYVEDERTSDIVINEKISHKTKKHAIKTIKSKFTEIATDVTLKKAINHDRLSVSFSKVVKNILEDINSNEDALALLSDAYIYDSYIFMHSLNVTVYTLGLAVKLGFTDEQLMEIGMGALLHDIGKVAVPPEILNKPGKLSVEEFDVIKTHPKVGFDLLRKVPNISLLSAHCAYQHHERIDGSGYPQGLQNDDIHEYAQIVGIADVFDAVTSHRTYRKPMLPHEALELLYAGVGTQFDLALIETFMKTVAVYPIGLAVALSDGKTGIVVKQNEQLSTHPVVRVISEDGKELSEPYDFDLQDHYNVTIVETEATLTNSILV